MNLVIDNHIIDTNLYDILLKLRADSNNRYLNTIRKSGDNIAISCPFHKDGQERHASCFVYLRNDNDNVPFGYFKCFTCKEQGQLYTLVSKCLDCSYKDAKYWLVDNFSNTFSEDNLQLESIDLSNKDSSTNTLDESILEKYKYIHPYMLRRKLTEDVIKKFNIGWNQETDAITFPVWDEHDNLIGITERSIKNKSFYIPSGINLPVYLLNYIIKENITEVYVTESQIDALTLWGYGYPAVALFGTGNKKAYDILKRSGVRVFHLCLDGDLAGRHGTIKFIHNMPSNIIIDVVQIPQGKDVNDLTKEEFNNLQHLDKYMYLQYINNNV